MKKAIMSVLTVWMLVSSMFIGVISFSDIETVKAPYIPHNPIRINSNAEFASMAGVEGWAGNGLPGNPYIIEGYDINGSGYGYCIYIGNTTVYFEIRESYMHEASGIGSDPYYSDSGITLYNAKNGTITNNTASNNRYGILLPYSSNTIITHNTASSNNWEGVFLFSSSKNTIVNNTISSNNDDGIELRYSSSNTIANNTVSSNSQYGIYLSSSSNHIIANNEMTDNGIFIWGDMLEHWNTHFIDTTNTVNGKPVHYWKNQTGGTVPLGAGQVILTNSTNVIVQNQNVSNGDVGIELGFSSNNTIINNTASSNNWEGISLYYSNNNTITNNNASNNWGGIFLYSSSDNTIANNTASNNWDGIFLSSSSNNTIANNIASSSNDYGISLYASSNNTIANNTASNNGYGMYVEGDSFSSFSSDNNIYHNNIINNTNQAYDNTNNGNQWDNGYPSGGNYWSDYTGIDLNSTGNQDVPPPDGIGDSPYIIDSDSQDNYPLFYPVGDYIFLNQGWNLVSIPFIQPGSNLDTVLSSINGSYDAVQWHNISDSSDPWKHFQIFKPSYLNDFSNIQHTIGFWIHITEPGGILFEYTGTQPTQNQSIPLHPGWNMVGYPCMTNRNRTAALNNLTFGSEVDAIWTFNAANKNWEEIGGGDYFEVGRGYWIHATQECVWEVPL